MIRLKTPFAAVRAFVATAAAALVICAAAAQAQAAETSPGVARLSVVDGSSVVIHDDGQSEPARLNAPLFEGDTLRTERGARAEISLTAHERLRLSGESRARLTSLESSHRVIDLDAGEYGISILKGRRGPAPEFRAPAVTWQPVHTGYYRAVIWRDGGALQLDARHGEAQFLTPSPVTTISQGDSWLAYGSPSAPVVHAVTATPLDDFDTFNTVRDESIVAALEAAQTYAAGVDGIDELADNGRWVDDPHYGEVWTPASVGPDWAPYQAGEWRWQPYYGWTWVSYDLWGWAPYHYGRWFYRPAVGWCWSPPRPAVVVPLWSPALVAFVNAGALQLGFAAGQNIGWVPLAPNEPLHPWWGPHTTIIQRTNITNIVVNRVNIYQNIRVRHAVGMMAPQAFARRIPHHIPLHIGTPVQVIRSYGERNGQSRNGRFPSRPAAKSASPNRPEPLHGHAQIHHAAGAAPVQVMNLETGASDEVRSERDTVITMPRSQQTRIEPESETRYQDGNEQPRRTQAMHDRDMHRGEQTQERRGEHEYGHAHEARPHRSREGAQGTRNIRER